MSMSHLSSFEIVKKLSGWKFYILVDNEILTLNNAWSPKVLIFIFIVKFLSVRTAFQSRNPRIIKLDVVKLILKHNLVEFVVHVFDVA